MYERRTGLRNFIILMMILLVTTYFIFDKTLEPSLLAMAKSRSQLMGQRIISQAVNEKIARKTEYQDLVTIHKDGEGRIVLLQPNTVKINRMMVETLLCIEERFMNMQYQTYTIPLGQATGSRLLSAYGPGIRVRTIPVGKVQVNMIDRFEEAGINQTRHLICLKVIGRIKVVIPLENVETTVSMTIPIAETIVVGQVPQTYLGLKSGEKIVNFIKDM